MVKLDLYWKSNPDWYFYENGKCILRNDAPEDAKKSYMNYCRKMESIDRRTDRTFVIPKTQAGINQYREYDPDWSLGSHETDDLIVYNIPYNEFCIIREKIQIRDYFDEDSGFIIESGIQKLIDDIIKYSLDVPKTISILHKSLLYHTFIDYVESNIL